MTMPRPIPPVDADTLVHGLVRIVPDPASPVGLRFAGPDEDAPRLDPSRLPPHRFEMHVLEDAAALRALVLGLRLGRRNDVAWLAHKDLPLLLLAELEASPQRGAIDIEDAIPVQAEPGILDRQSGQIVAALQADAAYRDWRRAAAVAVRRWRPALQALSGRRDCLLQDPRQHGAKKFSWKLPDSWRSFDFTPETISWENGKRVLHPHERGYRLVIDVSDHNQPSGALTRQALGAEADRALAVHGYAWQDGTGDKSACLVAICPDAETLRVRVAAAGEAVSVSRALRHRATERPREVAAMTQPKMMAALRGIVEGVPVKIAQAVRTQLITAGLIDEAGGVTEAGRQISAEYRSLAPIHPQDGPTFTQALYLASMACLDFTLGRSSWRSINVSKPYYGADTLKSPPEAQIDAMIARGWLVKGGKRSNGGDTEILLTTAGRSILPGAPPAPPTRAASAA